MIDFKKLVEFSPKLAVYQRALEQCVVDAALCTPQRFCDFIAQWAEETAGFTRTVENLSYSAERLLAVFPKHFTAEEADRYSRAPAQIANRVYADRMGNGPESSGDGWKYRGRGWPMLTGKDEYRRASAALFPDDPTRLLQHPELVEQPPLAATVAAWYWREGNPSGKSLNRFCERDDFAGLTRAINGGLLGLDERMRLRKKARTIFIGE